MSFLKHSWLFLLVLVCVISSSMGQSVWTKNRLYVTNNADQLRLYSIACNDKELAVLGTIGATSHLYASRDGVHWTDYSSLFGPERTVNNLKWIVWTDSTLVAAGSYSFNIRTVGDTLSSLDHVAVDSTNWQKGREPPDAAVWDGTKIVGIRGDIYSYDGIRWDTTGSRQTVPAKAAYRSISLCNGRLVVIADTNSMVVYYPPNYKYTSYISFLDNGVWTSRLVGVFANSNVRAGIWTGKNYVVAGSNGSILSSPDGTNFEYRMPGNQYILYSLARSQHKSVAVGANGKILISSDDTTWDNISSGTSGRLYSVIWTGTQFVAVGDSGTVLTSPDDGALGVKPKLYSPSLSKVEMIIRETWQGLSIILPYDLHGEIQSVSIFSLSGRRIMSLKNVTLKTGEISIDNRFLCSGAYMLEIKTRERTLKKAFCFGG